MQVQILSADTGKVLGAFVTAEPIDYPEVATAAMGAVGTFEGIVRNHDGGRGGVELLKYTAHPSADAEIARVADEVIAAHPKAR